MYFTTMQCITANSGDHSLCGLELTLVRNSRTYEKRSWLFKPSDLYIERSRLQLPELSLSQLIDAPYLYEVWDDIYPYFDEQLIIFHQLPENIRVLSKALEYYKLPVPSFIFGSTMMLAKRLYPHLSNTKLPSLCEYLGFSCSEEALGSTSFYMAQALLKIGSQLHEEDEETLFTKGGICLGSYQSDGITYPEFLSHYQPPLLETAAPSDKLQTWLPSIRNEVVCLTGPLNSMTRAMAVKKLTQKGGHYQGQVSAHTTLLVTNLYDPETGQYKKLTSKLQKALILKGQGQKIEIISEDLFLQKLQSASDD